MSPARSCMWRSLTGAPTTLIFAGRDLKLMAALPSPATSLSPGWGCLLPYFLCFILLYFRFSFCPLLHLCFSFFSYKLHLYNPLISACHHTPFDSLYILPCTQALTVFLSAICLSPFSSVLILLYPVLFYSLISAFLYPAFCPSFLSTLCLLSPFPFLHSYRSFVCILLLFI